MQNEFMNSMIETEIERLYEDVEPLAGEIGRYHVASRSGPHPHLVDLMAFNFNGQCDCENFLFRMRPLLERGCAPDAELRCWHLKRARAHFTETMLRALKGEMEKPKAPPWPTKRIAACQ